MSEGLDAFKSGQVALQHELSSPSSPASTRTPNVGGDKIGFLRQSRGEGAGDATRRTGHLGGVTIRKNQGEALQYIKWFAGNDVAEEVVGARRLFLCQGRAERSELPGQRAVRKEFLQSMDIVVDFWAEPSYAQLLQAEQKRVHDYVVADKGTAQEALDGLVRTGRPSQGRGEVV